MPTDIIGHKKVLDFFDKVINNQNLSHAYLFVGQEKIGKKTVAREISAKLLGLSKDKLKTSPDFVFVEQLKDEKTNKTKRDITVKQVRELRESLSRSAYISKFKVAIVDNAENMNVEAANALLKTLEEPKDNTVLFLITKDETKLPQTIQSRCQLINFSPVDKNLIQNFLENENLESNEAEEMARLSRGLPGLVLDWFKTQEKYLEYKQEVLRFYSLFGNDFHEKIKKVEDLFGDKTDHIATRQNLQNVLSIWQVLLRDLIYNDLGLNDYKIHRADLQKSLNVDDSKNLIDKIKEAKNLLRQNIHPRLLVENLLLELP